MAKKQPYTPEQIRQLSANPFTHSVTKQRIVFTREFKEFFAERMNLPGMTTYKIFAEAGYDSSLLTANQMTKFRKTLRTELQSGQELKNPRGLSKEERLSRLAEQDMTRKHTQKSIQDLQDRVVMLEQEVEFLKKISQIRKGL